MCWGTGKNYPLNLVSMSKQSTMFNVSVYKKASQSAYMFWTVTTVILVSIIQCFEHKPYIVYKTPITKWKCFLKTRGVFKSTITDYIRRLHWEARNISVLKENKVKNRILLFWPTNERHDNKWKRLWFQHVGILNKMW